MGNRKNGNKYLAWAFIEAANFAIRYNLKAKKFYERKKMKTNNLIALKALAHKLSRACYYIMKQGVPFDENKIFSLGLSGTVNQREGWLITSRPDWAVSFTLILTETVR